MRSEAHHTCPPRRPGLCATTSWRGACAIVVDASLDTSGGDLRRIEPARHLRDHCPGKPAKRLRDRCPGKRKPARRLRDLMSRQTAKRLRDRSPGKPARRPRDLCPSRRRRGCAIFVQASRRGDRAVFTRDRRRSVARSLSAGDACAIFARAGGGRPRGATSTPLRLDCPTGAGKMGTKKPARVSSSGSEKESGGDLLSHRGNSAVPSALEGLTSEFGMRSGGAPPVKPPEIAEMVAPSSDGAVVEPPCEAVRVE